MLKLKARGATLHVVGTFLGQRVRESTGLPVGMEAEANGKLRQIMADIAGGKGRAAAAKGAPATMTTFDEVAASYLDHKPALTAKSKWYVDQCLSRWSGTALHKINDAAVKTWIERDLAIRGPWLARRMATQLSAILNHGKEMGAASSVTKIKRPRQPKVLKRALSREDVESFIHAVSMVAPDALLILSFMAATGARPIEAARLTMPDVQGDSVSLRHRKGGGEWVERLMPLGTRAQKAVSAAIAAASKGSVLVFPGWLETEERVSQRLAKRVEDARIAAKLPDWVTAYTLRHSFATNLLRSGVDIRTVQALMGHSTIQQTAEYLAISRDHMKAAMGVWGFVSSSSIGTYLTH